MKRTLLIALTLSAILSIPSTSKAALSYWDSNGATAGAGATPTGTWGTSAFWSANSAGTSATAAWTSGNTAVFAAGTDAINAYNVTLNGTLTVGGLNVEEGTVKLTGSGAVAVGANAIVVGSGAVLSYDNSARITSTNGSTTTLNGGTLQNTVGSGAGTFLTQNTEIILGAAGGTFSYTGVNLLNIVQTGTKISGSGSLTIDGAGVLAFAMTAGNATYTGGTIINNGELRMRTTVNVLPTATDVTVNSPGIFNLNNIATTVGSVGGGGRVGLGNAVLTISGSTSSTLSGTIEDVANAGASGVSSTGGKVTRSGTGTTTLTASNSFTGGLTLSGGKVRVGNNNALGSGKLLLGAGTLSSDSTTARTISVAVDVTGNGTLGNATDSGALTFQTGAWTLTGNRSLSVASAVTVNSIIGESGAGRTLTKTGTGKLTLGGANTYTGKTTISAGTLALAGSGSISSSSEISVGSTFDATGRTDGTLTIGAAQKLSGAGTVIGDIVIAGTLAPGSSAGVLTNIGSLTLQGTSSTTLEIGGTTRGVQFDGLDISGTLSYDGTLLVSFINGYTGNLGDTFQLFNAAGYTGDFATTTLPTLGDGLVWDTSILGSAGSLGIVAVPEPTTIAFGLIGSAILGFGMIRRRR